MKYLFCIIILSSPILALADVLNAADLFKLWDDNKDSYVNRPEYYEHSHFEKNKVSAFDCADKNSDGKLDLSEFKQLPVCEKSASPTPTLDSLLKDTNTNGTAN